LDPKWDTLDAEQFTLSALVPFIADCTENLDMS